MQCRQSVWETSKQTQHYLMKTWWPLSYKAIPIKEHSLPVPFTGLWGTETTRCDTPSPMMSFFQHCSTRGRLCLQRLFPSCSQTSDMYITCQKQNPKEMGMDSLPQTRLATWAKLSILCINNVRCCLLTSVPGSPDSKGVELAIHGHCIPRGHATARCQSTVSGSQTDRKMGNLSFCITLLKFSRFSEFHS